MPQGYDLRADAVDGAKLAAEVARVREQVKEAAVRMPNHEDFIAQYCPAARGAGAMA
jgi:tryptophan halogenase